MIGSREFTRILMSAKLVFGNIYRRCQIEPEMLLAVALP